MEFNENTLTQLAQQMALVLTPAQKATFNKDLRQIIHWVGKLNELDTTHIAPQTTMSVETNILAEDTPKPPLSLPEALLNAPKHDGVYFHVPAIAKKKTSDTERAQNV